MIRPGCHRGALTAAAAAALAACAPVSITFTFGERPAQLRESTVLSDPGRPRPKVALIPVRGVLVDGPRGGLLLPGASPVDELASRLDRAADDPDVRAVVVRINSPGGSVAATDLMYRELRRFADETGKPVVASLAEVGASGGYYLALAADEVIAQPTTLTGSVGVIVPTINLSEGLSRLGIRSRAVTSGPNKDLANPLEPMRESHYALLQSIVDEFYGQFRATVLERRAGAHRATIEPLLDGRIVTGQEAARAGLVDGTGDLRDAFERAKRRAGVDVARLVVYHDRGRHPRSPYAWVESSTAPPGSRDGDASPGSGTWPLAWLSAVDDYDLWPTAYYLWLPTAP